MNKLFLLLLLLTAHCFSFGQISNYDHNDAVDLINDSQALIQKKQYNEAISKLENAVKLDSTIRDTYLLIYQAGFYGGNLEIAKSYLKKAKTISLEDDEVAYYLGKIYQQEKNYDAALVEFDEAIKYGKINGEDYPIVYDYYASRGACYLIQEKYQEALDDLNYSLKLNSTKGSVYMNKATALFKLNSKEEACISWRKAYELGVNSAKDFIIKNCK